MMLLCMSFTGCNKCSSGDTSYVDKIQYSLTAEGQTDGCIDIMFPNGEFQADGLAALLFKISSNDSLQLAFAGTDLTDALVSSNTVQRNAAIKVENDLNKIQIASAEGEYYIRLKGFAKEPITGIVFAIDKTYTNKH